MRGFFLVELIAVISLITIFATLSITGYLNFEKFFVIKSAENEVRTILDRTRNLAIAMYQNDGWSFRIQDNQAMIFKGNNYSSRDTEFDEKYDLPRKTFATTTSDIYFEALTGSSASATTIINSGTSTVEITISNTGIIR